MKEKYCNDRADGDGGGSSGRGGNHRIIRLHKSADSTRQTQSAPPRSHETCEFGDFLERAGDWVMTASRNIAS